MRPSTVGVATVLGEHCMRVPLAHDHYAVGELGSQGRRRSVRQDSSPAGNEQESGLPGCPHRPRRHQRRGKLADPIREQSIDCLGWWSCPAGARIGSRPPRRKHIRSASSSSTSLYNSAQRTYLRTAVVSTYGGDRNPANPGLDAGTARDRPAHCHVCHATFDDEFLFDAHRLTRICMPSHRLDLVAWARCGAGCSPPSRRWPAGWAVREDG